MSVTGAMTGRGFRVGLGAFAMILMAGAGACLAGRAVAAAWLGAAFFATGLLLGGSAMLMVAHLTGGRWARSIMSYLESLAAGTPLLLALWIPLAIRAGALYPWANSGDAGPHGYYAPAFVVARSAICLATWVIGGPLIASVSARDRSRDRVRPGLRAASAIGLIVLAITMTSVSYDWSVAMNPQWASTMFPLIVLVSQALTAFGAAVGMYAWDHRVRGEPFPETPVLRDLGNILLTLVILHAYVHFSQFFIIWNGNVPERTSWYEPRVRGWWGLAIVLLVIFQFALPLALLLFRAFKASNRAMTALGALLVVDGALEMCWLMIPGAHVEPRIAALWAIPIAAILAVAVWLWARGPQRPRIAWRARNREVGA
jgi:hypothetical protein